MHSQPPESHQPCLMTSGCIGCCSDANFSTMLATLSSCLLPSELLLLQEQQEHVEKEAGEQALMLSRMITMQDPFQGFPYTTTPGQRPGRLHTCHMSQHQCHCSASKAGLPPNTSITGPCATAIGLVLLPQALCYCHRPCATAAGLVLLPQALCYCHRPCATAMGLVLLPQALCYCHRPCATAIGLVLLPKVLCCCQRSCAAAKGLVLLPKVLCCCQRSCATAKATCYCHRACATAIGQVLRPQALSSLGLESCCAAVLPHALASMTIYAAPTASIVLPNNKPVCLHNLDARA
jgi:hypothetical protein